MNDVQCRHEIMCLSCRAKQAEQDRLMIDIAVAGLRSQRVGFAVEVYLDYESEPDFVVGPFGRKDAAKRWIAQKFPHNTGMCSIVRMSKP